MTQEPARPTASGVHADRVAGGDRHHRHPHRPAAAGRAEGPRGRRTHPVRQQPQADRPGPALLPRRQRQLPARHADRHDLSDRRKRSTTSITCCPTSSRPRYYNAYRPNGVWLQPQPYDVPGGAANLYPQSINGVVLSVFCLPQRPQREPHENRGRRRLRTLRLQLLGMCSGLNDATCGAGTPAYPATQRRPCSTWRVGMRFADITDGTSSSLAVVEYLDGLSDQRRPRLIITNRAGCQFLYASATPNSPTPDVLLDLRASARARRRPQWTSSHNQPGQNLPCVASGNSGGYGGQQHGHVAQPAHGRRQWSFSATATSQFISNSDFLPTWQSLAWIRTGPSRGATIDPWQPG